MRLLSFSLLVVLLVGSAAFAQKSPSEKPAAKPERPADALYNIYIGTDERLFVVMAALAAAGFNDETPGFPPNELRGQLLRDLGPVDPDLKKRLENFFAVHRRPDRDRAGQAAGYVALSLVLGPAPTFAAPKDREFLPDDVNDIIGFAPLVADFYAKTPIKTLVAKYAQRYYDVAAGLQPVVAEEVGNVLSLLHTNPILQLPGDDTPLSRQGGKDSNAAPGPAPLRTRRLFILPELLGPNGRVYARNDVLDASDTKTFRRAGDDYLLWIGGHSAPPAKGIRLMLMRYFLEPVVAKSGVAVALRRPEITDVVEHLAKEMEKNKSGRPVEAALQRNVFAVVRESLLRAVEAKLDVMLVAGTPGKRPSREELRRAEDNATYDLSVAYERGAVMAFHFFEQLEPLERGSVDIADWLPKMIESFEADREKRRPREYAETRARVEKQRTEVVARIAGGDTSILGRLAEAETLILGRRYAEARPILEAVLKQEPKNSRATFGLAQVLNNDLTPVERDPNADEGDKISAQEERLAKAVETYKTAIGLVKPDEKWLASQAYVLIGRIYDFVQLRDQAVAAYDQAIAIGDIPRGAYKDAVEGKQRPFTEKKNPE